MLSLLLPNGCRSFAPSNEPPVLIDLRDQADFEQRHLVGASNFPVETLRERMYQLPPPGEWPLALIGSERELQVAEGILAPKGWSSLHYNTEDETLWKRHAHESGATSTVAWRPNSFLAAVLRNVQLPHRGVAVDVGCGSGRDAVHIARMLGAEWSVFGVDNHRAALQRASKLAQTNGLDVSFEELDIRKQGLLGLSEKPISLLHCCRFLHRPLMEELPTLLDRGGLVIYSHFVDPLNGVPLAPPFRQSRRLQHGELRKMLGESAGFEVLCDVTGQMMTRSKWIPAAFFVAKYIG